MFLFRFLKKLLCQIIKCVWMFTFVHMYYVCVHYQLCARDAHTDAVLSQNEDEFFVFNLKEMKKICKEQHRSSILHRVIRLLLATAIRDGIVPMSIKHHVYRSIS